MEPLFTLATSELLVPLSHEGLRSALRKHKDKLKPAIYRWSGIRRVRFLYASDIVVLRSIYFNEELYPRRPETEQ